MTLKKGVDLMLQQRGVPQEKVDSTKQLLLETNEGLLRVWKRIVLTFHVEILLDGSLQKMNVFS